MSNVPIVLLSEYTIKALDLKLDEIDYYVAKPILPKILERKIKEVFLSKN